ncbi:LuxR C-terminal-related transcriptional regulator [Amycolatopsis sp. OK19-0408]|uniref:LuxR C-terminal-related transcriptional regulator n=1 Tax=Amycolatopsis iheyensis TaxID=2945988 RepID=A0A9X2NGN9_9PSEU|nr:LuxR C-terminal-related transcriptional regulator [Amycolatopsis iheyensis]MCR6488339.1 LuxR C-terminal-related transcriptional regulator [Amycolatopsis iheyensis]
MTVSDDDLHFASRDAPSRTESSVPVELDSFIGRSRLLERGRTLLNSHGTRLVTLTGFGGVGKTRLLLRLAHELTASRGYPDGVFVAGLAELREGGDRLYAAVADALHIQDSASTPGLDRLRDYFRDRQLLLMLDNCEHLIGDMPGTGPVPTLLNTLLQQAAGLQVVATSRERLGVRGERLLLVPPLCVGDEDRCDCGADNGGVHDALQLLIDRAAELGVTIRERDYDTAARLCRRLDGIPLGIELAAVPLAGNAMTLQALTEHADLLSLLDRGTSGQSNHQTLHAMVDWSYSRLPEPEQKLWALASMFEGTFDREAIKAIGLDNGIVEAEVQPLLISLVGKNVLKGVERQNRLRYRMLETIRQYGQLVVESGQAPRSRQAYTSYLETLAERGTREWQTRYQLEWMLRLNEFRPDLIAIQRHLLATRQTAARGLELAIHVTQTCAFIFGGRLNENLRMLGAGLAQHPDAPSANQVTALSLAAWIALIQGNHERAAPLLSHAEAAATALGVADDFGPLDVARGTWLWLAEQNLTRARRALTAFRGAASAFRAAGAKPDEWMARLFLTMSAASLGRLDVAKAESVTLLADAEAAEAPWCISWALWCRALVKLLDGKPHQATESAQKALCIQLDIGDAWGPVLSLWLLALIAARLGDYEAAARVLGGAQARQLATQATVLQTGPFLRLQRLAEAAGRHELGDDEVGDDRWTIFVTSGQNSSADEMHALALGPLGTTPQPTTPRDGLSPREFEVARLIAKGLTNKEIAGHLTPITPRTVGVYVTNINHKLGTKTRAAIAAWYLTMVAPAAGRRNQDSP